MADHATLTGDDLHECKGAASATANTVQLANGSGGATWGTVDYRAAPAGWPLQIVHATTSDLSLPGTIPQDNTIPQITEGDEVLTLAITPKHASSILIIKAEGHAQIEEAGSESYCAALFVGATADALAAVASRGHENHSRLFILQHRLAAGTTDARTYRLRLGAAQDNLSVNGSNGVRVFGGVSSLTMTIWEIKQ